MLGFKKNKEIEKFIKEVFGNLNDALDGKSCVVFTSKLHGEDGSERLDHHMSVGEGFKNDDLVLCLEAYKELITDYLDYNKNSAQEALNNISGVEVPKKPEDSF